jgi:hypothetical protein
MKKWFATLALLAMSGSSLALAQDAARNPPPPSVKRAQQGQPAAAAPVGHRQPRIGDVPSATGPNDPAKMDAQDRELDRMIKNICRGC